MTCSFARSDRAKALLGAWLALVAASCGAADTTLQDRDEPPPEEVAIAVAPAVNACPTIASYFILPQRIRPNEAASILVQGIDLDSDDNDLSYAWSATAGEFTEPARPFTEYRCEGTGPQVLTVTASDKQGCDSVLSLDVDCADD